MKINHVLTCLLLFPLAIVAQTKPQPYRLSAQIEAQLATDTVEWKYQKAAWDYTYSGHYLKALQTWDAQQPNTKQKVTAKDSAFFAAYAPSNAKDYLLDRTAREQIIIINEAHHNPRHRAFTQSLLKDLYTQGYRYLGLEALDQTDSLLNQRKYPTLASGYYTKEPQMGNLIREALQLGFTVFGYDAESNGMQREIGQARNIQQVLQKDPKAKMILHCGFDHITEGPYEAWEKAMAGRLKEFTGIDPLTIDQEDGTETSATRFDSPFFQLTRQPYTAVFARKDNGHLFTGTNKRRQVDVAVVHPRTKLVNGRPDWLWLEGRKPLPVPAEKITVGFPCLALAYKMGENEQAVPVDVVEIPNKTTKISLALPKGAYRLELVNATNQKQTLEIKVK